MKKIFSTLSILAAVLAAAGFLWAATLATDNFTRADENPLSGGGNWSALAGTWTSMEVLSNVAVSSMASSCSAAFYSGRTWPANQWSQETWSSLSTNGSVAAYALVMVRAGTDGVTNSGYLLTAGMPLGTDQNWYLQKVGSGGGAGTLAMKDMTATPLAVGDTLYLEIQGSTLVAKRNGVVVSGLTATDSTFTTGAPGIGVCAATSISESAMSAWAGGNFPSSSGGPGVFVPGP
jgi:hypothetical protein